MSFGRFIRSRVFFKHIGLAIVATIFLLWITLRLLDLYTRHNQAIPVPEFIGMHISELEDFADEYGLNYEINDSLYDYSLEKGTVILQDPLPGTKVKRGRRIYLTVVAQKPEMVRMPNLVDLTLRQASSMLETYGLLVGKLKYVPDIAHNAVLEQLWKGKKISEGTLIEKGSKIDLILGEGEDMGTATVPDLVGKKQSEAQRLLREASLNIGVELFEDGNDTSNVFIYKQRPSAGVGISFGGTVDLWYKKK